MAVNGITNPTPDYTSATKQTKTENDRTTLGYEDFLSLFVKSLQYQDPSTPMDNSEMMNQMSQIGFMQAVTEMQTTINGLKDSLYGNQIQQGAGMLGKEVMGTATDGQIVTGVVDKVQVNDGIMSLLVNNKMVSIGNVNSVEIPRPNSL